MMMISLIVIVSMKKAMVIMTLQTVRRRRMKGSGFGGTQRRSIQKPSQHKHSKKKGAILGKLTGKCNVMMMMMMMMHIKMVIFMQ